MVVNRCFELTMVFTIYSKLLPKNHGKTSPKTHSTTTVLLGYLFCEQYKRTSPTRCLKGALSLSHDLVLIWAMQGSDLLCANLASPSLPVISPALLSITWQKSSNVFKKQTALNQTLQNNRLGGGGGRYRRLTRLWWDWLVQNMKSERWRKKCNQVKLQNQFNHTCSHLLTSWSFKPAGLSFCFGTQNVNSWVIIIIIIYIFFLILLFSFNFSTYFMYF